MAAAGSSTREAETQQRPPPSAVVELSLSGTRRRTLELGGAAAATAAADPAEHAAGAANEGSGPLAAVRSFFLPRGWPHSVTPDYLKYQVFHSVGVGLRLEAANPPCSWE